MVLSPGYECAGSPYTQCVFKDACINEEFGLFYLNKDPELSSPPQCFLPGLTYEPWNYSTTPLVLEPGLAFNMKVNYQWDTALVVEGTYSPFHLAHELANSVIGLQHLLISHQLEGRRLHLLSVGRFPTKNEAFHKFPMESLGFSRLFSAGAQATNGVPYSHLSLLDGKTFSGDPLQGETLCYPKVVVGLGAVCPHCRNLPSLEAYTRLRDHMLEYLHVPKEPVKDRVLVLERKGKRRVVNQADLVKLLDSLDVEYHVIAPEALSFEEQVAAFSKASIFIAPHGNGNSHIYWMAKNTTFIELFNGSGYGDGFFRSQALQRGMNYFSMTCPKAMCATLPNKHPNTDDMYADLPAIEHRLRDLLRLPQQPSTES